MRAFVGSLALQVQPRPLSVAGQFSLAADREQAARMPFMPLFVAAVLVAPAFVTLAAGVLRARLGFAALFDAISTTPALSALVALSLFVGAPAAVLLILLPVARFQLSRDGGTIATSVELRATLVHLALAVLAILVAGIFFGHLVADEFACWRGITSSC